MHKFANKDHVSFEFFLDSCVVKDLRTRESLMTGAVNGNLYVFDTFPVQQHLHTVHASSNWNTSVNFHIAQFSEIYLLSHATR